MRQFCNKNLVTLKCVLFAFFAGIGCLFPFMTAHIRAVGLTFEDACIISIVASFFAILGPLIFGPLADKLSVGRGCETTIANGKSDNPNTSIIVSSGNGVLRFMIAICILLSALFYALLMAVPYSQHLEARMSSVSFMCDAKGATVFQEMCSEESTCHHWDSEKLGSLLLSDCHYECEKPPEVRPLYLGSISTSESPSEQDYDIYDAIKEGEGEVGPEAETLVEEDEGDRKRRALKGEPDVEPPHLCYTSAEHQVLCEAFTEHSKLLKIDASLQSATPVIEDENQDSENATSWCKYPMGGNFQCLVPASYVKWLEEKQEGNATCNPVIQCNVEDPYDSPNSVLAESQCKRFIGDPSFSFWTYLVLRVLGDIFFTAALCLLCTACVIATRETSIGRGDVGRQLLFGVIGLTIIPPLIGVINLSVPEATLTYVVPITSAVILFIIAAVIILFAKEIPLSPPEWWWHTKSGMLALPMNTVRRYGLEIVGVMLVLVVLGIFWSGLNTYLPWAVKEMIGSDMILSLTMSVGALPAIPVLWKAERLVDYCGHSNIFIAAFTFYILKYTGMAILDNPWWVLMCEAFEMCTLSFVWVTAVLYFRHLVPRKFTSTGQALPVIAHFCLGRCFGALIGLAVKKGSLIVTLQSIYEDMAIAACVLGLVYLALYHLLLAPWCRASTTGPPNPLAMQGLNGNGTSNGNYTPLRVYHNERGRKGQFRY